VLFALVVSRSSGAAVRSADTPWGAKAVDTTTSAASVRHVDAFVDSTVT